MLIEVTREDIQNGKRSVCAACPVSIAIRRACSTPVSVAATQVYGLSRRAIDLPSEAMSFISAFDRGEPVAPFSFELDYAD